MLCKRAVDTSVHVSLMQFNLLRSTRFRHGSSHAVLYLLHPCISSYFIIMQQPDGSFYGDKWGEVDTRFSFCAVAALALLNRLDAIDVPKATEFVISCMNFDGGFGCRPGSETHSGQVSHQIRKHFKVTVYSHAHKGMLYRLVQHKTYGNLNRGMLHNFITVLLCK